MSCSSPAGWPATATWLTLSTSGRSPALRRSTWAKDYYDSQRARGKDHHAALRTLGNRWLEILWHCLQRQVPYDEAAHLVNRTRALQPAA